LLSWYIHPGASFLVGRLGTGRWSGAEEDYGIDWEELLLLFFSLALGILRRFSDGGLCLVQHAEEYPGAFGREDIIVMAFLWGILHLELMTLGIYDTSEAEWRHFALEYENHVHIRLPVRLFSFNLPSFLVWYNPPSPACNARDLSRLGVLRVSVRSLGIDVTWLCRAFFLDHCISCTEFCTITSSACFHLADRALEEQSVVLAADLGRAIRRANARRTSTTTQLPSLVVYRYLGRYLSKDFYFPSSPPREAYVAPPGLPCDRS